MAILTVKTSGGDFTTIQAAFDFIETQSPLTVPYTIEVYNDTTESTYLHVSAVTTAINKIKIVGIGSVKPIISIATSASQDNFSTQYLEFENLAITVTGEFYTEGSYAELGGLHSYNKIHFIINSASDYQYLFSTNRGNHDLRFVNCVFKDIELGFDNTANKRNIDVINNTFFNVRTNLWIDGYSLTEACTFTLKNNIFYVYNDDALGSNIALYSYYCTTLPTFVLENNMYFNNQYPFKIKFGNDSPIVYTNFNDYKIVSGETGTEQNPLLTNPSGGDFTLTALSPAVDTGVNTGISQDFIGTSRPQGSGYDIGAYEYPQESPPLLLCWQLTAEKTDGQIFQLNGDGPFPKEIDVPDTVILDTILLIDEGIEIAKSEYKINII